MLNPLVGQLCGKMLSLLINHMSMCLSEETAFYFSLHEELLFSLSLVHTYMEKHFAHMLPAFPKYFKKSFHCVLARDRVPAGLQHQTLGQGPSRPYGADNQHSN